MRNNFILGWIHNNEKTCSTDPLFMQQFEFFQVICLSGSALRNNNVIQSAISERSKQSPGVPQPSLEQDCRLQGTGGCNCKGVAI
jgi:hypothetical protein